ncbi:MAG TPA: SusC/RagA family TonB-linked outer membrane protein [Gemmatimonadaceae bacterium]
MKTRVLTVLLGILLSAAQAGAQQKTVTGRVTDEQGTPLSGASVVIKGTSLGTATSDAGHYSIRAAAGQVLQFRYLGTTPEERVVGADSVINVQLHRTPTSLNAMVVTALGQSAMERSLGVAQQTVSGAHIAESNRENFVDALQGRVAGVTVTSTSGVPGASSSITIRGVSSISSSNQPLMVIDGMPMDNKTLNTEQLASDRNSLTAFSNRGVDFTNRAADINPEDIESITVLKGPEAAALYGIDAANGAIVITTKRGKAGGGLTYSNSFRIESVRDRPEIQRVYGPSDVGSSTFLYFGAPYADTTTFYDNVSGFFRTALTQNHQLSFSGASSDNRVNYRLSTGLTKQEGVIPGADYKRINLTGASQGQPTKWLSVDLSTIYSHADNDQTFKGAGGPLLGLMVWPATDNAADYLTPAGTRRKLTDLSGDAEVDNPYFNIAKNKINSKNDRFIADLALTFTPVSWGSLKTILGTDGYTNQNLLLRHPESTFGYALQGILDQGTDVTRNLNAQTTLNFNPVAITKDLSISGLLGNAVTDQKSTVDAVEGDHFLDPNFVSINNTNLSSPYSTITRRRLVSAFGQAVVDYRHYLYLTVTGRNDWTSTIPQGHNSFFYPSITSSFVFSDAFPSLGRFMTGKLRAAYAEVGKDARPYAYRPALVRKTTSFGGFGYDFWGPNLKLRPEFAKSWELGTEMSFLDDRLGLDVTLYQKKTTDQIVNNIRGSYATGFILFNLNGATTRNRGLEISLRGTPIRTPDFSWDILANFDRSRGTVLSLPNDLPESYVSDTWLYGNVRAGVAPGMSTMALTGRFYERNKDGKLLIDPSTGLPIRASTFIDAGYDRQPDFTVGLSNTFRYKRLNLDFLLDIRRGGDIFNATEHYLTTKGLAPRTLDRDRPRVIEGVLRDGLENTDHPTTNTIVVTPATQPDYYTDMSEELFIEKDINWLRLRHVRVSYELPPTVLKNASVFLQGNDLFLITNYTGLDPVVNGNDAAVGGAGGVGIDFGNFPIPRSIDFGIKVGF